MRHLVACPDCTRQFDATGHPTGSHFRCLCGRSLAVPEPQPHDAAVIRCSACGAPREKGAPDCTFCGADFTLHERDLHTICPVCAARVSDRARYCHHCATPLLPQPLGEATDHPCPACGEEVPLDSRRLGDEAVAVLECPRCAGLWVRQEAFALLIDRARRISQPEPGPAAPAPSPTEPQTGALYRPCPECGVLMHRRNYGRRSGVILDSCASHGLWFDARELEELLRWVRHGGEAMAAARQTEEKRQLDRQQRLGRELGSETGELAVGGNESAWLLETLGRILNWWVG